MLIIDLDKKPTLNYKPGKRPLHERKKARESKWRLTTENT